MNAGAFAKGRTQSQNVKAVIDDILGHGNENCVIPGQFEAEAAARCAKNGGLLFSEAEIQAARAIMNRLGLTEAMRQKAIDLFNQGKQSSFDLEETLKKLVFDIMAEHYQKNNNS